ncbi:hypothetical protein MMC24_005039 [Lignoscripta atroalba]|nr:hypothetical protein [Lignoscripta atroalba]
MSTLSPVELFPPEDKAFDFSSHILDRTHDIFFDQYVNPDSSEPSDNIFETALFENVDFDFDAGKAPKNSHALESSPPVVCIEQDRSEQAWRADSRRHRQKPDLFSHSCPKLAHRSRPDGQVISGIDLLNLEGRSRPPAPCSVPVPVTPSTPPATPLRRKAKFSAITPVALRDQDHRVAKSPSRTVNSSPKMMRPSFYSTYESPPFNGWEQRFEHFNIEAPTDNLPLSPPPSSRLHQHGSPTRLVIPPHGAQGSSRSSRLAMVRSEPRLRRRSRIPSEISQPQTRDTNVPQLRRSTNSMRPATHDLTISPSQVHHDWTFEESSQGSFYHDGHPLPGAPHQDFSASSQDFASQGLMIYCDPYTDFLHNEPSQDYFAAPRHHTFASGPMEDYFPEEISPGTSSAGHLQQQHQQQHQHQHDQEQEQEQELQTSTSPSPSPLYSAFPPPSPHTPSPSNSNSNSNSNHSTTTPPSEHPHPYQPSRSTRPLRRKTSAQTPTPLTIPPPSTPQTPTPQSPFINFTPSDSRKILTGVAPSGSSKTKARREREATEKRRKMSAAAVRAVRDAGGDVEGLVGRGGLFGDLL